MDIRFASRGDAAAIAEIYRPYVEQTAVSFELEPPGASEMAERLEQVRREYPYLVAVEDDDVVGYSYGHRFAERAAYRWSAEASIYLRQGVGGRGIGRRLYTALIELLALQGYREVFGGISLPNPASVALHESLGFSPVARFERVGWKLGEWHAVGWWQRPLADPARATVEPVGPIAIDDLDPEDVRAVLRAGG